MNPIMMMVNSMVQSNPQLMSAWQQAQQMASGKSKEEIQNIIRNIAKTQNIDLNEVQNQFNQFVGGFQNSAINRKG